ncbi:3-dehydroquinate synthase [Alkalihalobacillus oceani]|uniref:3-dehydroquinate synthase n=1 Tax=Halalkalibacter oceani TaxID=1653776 RepID=UPI00204060AC|nr:3-dehydroquinate synthase [Halalkalibacter oceani]MCM3761223.1 3-dehydroquinate synthase [Halalkalibacter oceani]
MRKVAINTPSKSYDVFIEAGLRREIGRRMDDVLVQPASSVLIISDSVVAPLYLDDVKNSFSGLAVHTAVITAGEASKSFAVYEQLLTKALEAGLDRKSVIVALGGGVVGDIAGFVAATFMRGIRFIQVPTTLLAHDSSVGGKVAINHPLGKNMVGSFHQPEAVFYDTEVLYSLSEREWRSGFAEVMKHGLIRKPSFLTWLQTTVSSLEKIPVEVLDELLEQSIAVKAEIVAEDEREAGVRAYLNLGHTLGHALETKLGYGKLTHGEAVVIGIVFAMRLSTKLCGLSANVDDYEKWFQSLGYETKIPAHLQADELIETMMKDKKTEGGTIRMVLLRSIGEATTMAVSSAEIKQFLVERAEVD